jgi:hypothetical protein
VSKPNRRDERCSTLRSLVPSPRFGLAGCYRVVDVWRLQCTTVSVSLRLRPSTRIASHLRHMCTEGDDYEGVGGCVIRGNWSHIRLLLRPLLTCLLNFVSCCAQVGCIFAVRVLCGRDIDPAQHSESKRVGQCLRLVPAACGDALSQVSSNNECLLPSYAVFGCVLFGSGTCLAFSFSFRSCYSRWFGHGISRVARRSTPLYVRCSLLPSPSAPCI